MFFVCRFGLKCCRDLRFSNKEIVVRANVVIESNVYFVFSLLVKYLLFPKFVIKSHHVLMSPRQSFSNMANEMTSSSMVGYINLTYWIKTLLLNLHVKAKKEFPEQEFMENGAFVRLILHVAKESFVFTNFYLNLLCLGADI